MTARRRRLVEVAELRGRQQAAIAELGQMALSGGELPALLDRAVRLVAQVLGVEMCKVLELLPDGSALLLRAGVGWREGLVGHATVGTGVDSQAGFTLASREPVVVEDMQTERRFHGPALLCDHHVVSGVSAIIGDPGRAYGVLGVHSTRSIEFSMEDAQFVQGVATLLATAVRQQEAERALRASEDRFKWFFEHSNVGESITLPSGEVSVNRALCDLLGYTAAELEHVTWQSISHPGDIESTQRVVDAILSGAQDSARFTKRYLHKDGSVVWADVSTTLRRNEAGAPLYFMTAILDITERVRAADLLTRQLDELRRWHQATLGRERRVLELKQEVNALLAGLGQPPRYPSAEGESDQ